MLPAIRSERRPHRMRIRTREGRFYASLIACFIVSFWNAAIHPACTANALSPNGRMLLQLKPFDARTLQIAKTYRRSLSTLNQNEVVPLNLGMGTHYTWIYVGTPPQRVSIIIDTGSGMTAFPCSECNQCGNHTDIPFNTSLSSSIQPISCKHRTYFSCAYCRNPTEPCRVEQTYMEGSSWSAEVMEDVVYLGDVASGKDTNLLHSYSTRYMFGCQNKETGLFIPQVADGIMGIHNSENDIVTKLFREKKISSNTFTLCFAPRGGFFALGATVTSRHAGEVSYARINDAYDESYYAVFMTDIRVGGHSINIDMKATNSYRYIVDSGTTNSVIPGRAGQALLDLYRNLTHLKRPLNEKNCFQLSPSQIDRLPTLQFVMEGTKGDRAILEILPSQYLEKDKDNSMCFNILVNTRDYGGVIGASMMMNHDVIFDRSQNKVGFVPANCTFAGDTEPNAHEKGIHDDANVPLQEVEKERPVIVKLVGTLLVLAFFGAIILSFKLKQRKQRKQRKDWSRVNENEEDAASSEDMDDDEEFGLVDAEANDRSNKKGKALRTQRSDEMTELDGMQDEEEAAEVRISDKRYMSIEQEASDQEDEIFESKAEESTYHTNVLERM